MTTPRESDIMVAASLAGLRFKKLDIIHPHLGVEIRVLVWCSTWQETTQWMDWLEERFKEWSGGTAIRAQSKGSHHTLDFHRGF